MYQKVGGLVLALVVGCAPVWAQDELDDLFGPDVDAEDEPQVVVEPGPEHAEPISTIAVGAEKPAKLSKKPADLEEIVVTAQRRQQALIDVPIAVTALNADALESRGIGRIDALNSIAPGLQISRSPANTTISQIAIRGASQINPALYWDPAVGLYLDGVYIGKAQGSIFDVIDLESIEVLRGPQGTLYGRNTLAGTINLITRKPSGEFGGTVALEYGRFDQQVGRVSMDFPSLGPLALSFGLRRERRDGWVSTTDTSPVRELNNRVQDGFQLGAKLDLSDDLQAMYRFDLSDIDQSNTFLQLIRHDQPGTEQYQSRERQTTADINAPSFERAKTSGHSLSLSWSPLDAVTIKSITGQREVTWGDALDLDGTPDQTGSSMRLTDYEQFSQDLNISGGFGRWQYTGGLYFFKDDGFTNNPLNLLNGVLTFDSRYGTHTEAWAVYGQTDWQATDRLTVTAGLRHTSEDKVLDRVLGLAPNPAAPFVYYINEGFSTPKATFDATTPLLSLGWAFNERMNSYLRYAEGFKSGGFNGEYSNTQDTPDDGNPDTQNDNQTQTSIPFRPERQRTLELGLKGHWLDGLLSANLALFHNQLEDLQASIFTGGGAAATVVRNAGEATMQGLELETIWRLGTTTRLILNLALLDAEYDVFEDEDADGNFGNQAQNRAFVHAPRSSWNFVLDTQLMPLGSGVLRLVMDYAWTDAFYTYPYQLSDEGEEGHNSDRQVAGNSEVQAQGLLNARLAWDGLQLGGHTLELALQGRNLLDEDSMNNFIDFGPGAFMNLTTANFVEPVSYSLTASWRF